VINVFDYRAFTFYRHTFQSVRLTLVNPMPQSRNTIPQAEWFRLVRFRSPLLTQSRLIYFPSGTEMFHFPESHFRTLCIQMRMTAHNGRRVAPFGYLRIKVCVPLPEAFRSLPRPSSPRDAKASIVCPYTLGRRVFLSSISRLRCNFSFPDYAIFKDQVPLSARADSASNKITVAFYRSHTVAAIPSVKISDRFRCQVSGFSFNFFLHSSLFFPHSSNLPRKLVGVPGIEPGTSTLSGLRSNQLSYTPV